MKIIFEEEDDRDFMNFLLLGLTTREDIKLYVENTKIYDLHSNYMCSLEEFNFKGVRIWS